MTPANLRIFRSYFRLPPQPGGMEQHIARLTEAQRQLGVDVVSVYNVGQSNEPEFRILEGRDLNKVSSNTVRELLFYTAGLVKVLSPKDGRYNILHVHGDFASFAAAKLWRRKLRITTMAATVHAKLTRPPIFYQRALKGYDVIVSTGAEDARQLSRWLDREVLHMPSGVAECFFTTDAAFAAQEPNCDVIAVGSLSPVKRIELIVELAATLPDLRFSIYGDGPLRPMLEEMALQKTTGNVTFHGRQPHEIIAGALHRARLFLNVSDNEGTPTSALEAMACGLPVVLTPSNGYDWLIKPGVNGYVTESWDLREIREKVIACLDRESQRKAMGTRNLAVGAQHRWEPKAKAFTDKLLQSIAFGTS